MGVHAYCDSFIGIAINLLEVKNYIFTLIKKENKIPNCDCVNNDPSHNTYCPECGNKNNKSEILSYTRIQDQWVNEIRDLLLKYNEISDIENSDEYSDEVLDQKSDETFNKDKNILLGDWINNHTLFILKEQLTELFGYTVHTLERDYNDNSESLTIYLCLYNMKKNFKETCNYTHMFKHMDIEELATAKDRMKAILEPLNLWNDDKFGIYTSYGLS